MEPGLPSGKPLRVLIIEDSENDTLLMVDELRRGGYQPDFKQVFTAAAMYQALKEENWDVILSDHNMPSFSSPAALKVMQECKLDIPFIIVSGSIGEETAVVAMKSGAHDYLMKENLARLVPAIDRELRDAAVRAAQRRAEEALRESEQRNRLLWENSSDAVVLMEQSGTIQFANPVVETIFGYRPQELIGREFLILLPEESRNQYKQLFRTYSQSGSGGKTSRRIFETTGLHKQGKVFPLEVAFSDMELGGKHLFVAFLRDVTERKRAEEELRENQEQFRVAREIQQRLFPERPPDLPGFDLYGQTLPAEATGGDYYDFVPMVNGCWGLVVADVTGHGVGPALLMAETRAYLRILAHYREDVGDILTQANRVLAQDVGMERFVTLLFVKLDPVHRTVTYVNAGHPAGYILTSEGKVCRSLTRSGVPLGIRPDTSYATSDSIPLADGEILLCLTDGFEEAMAPDDTVFGVDRTLEVIREHRQEDSKSIVEALVESVRGFSRGLAPLDDLTVIVGKVGPSGPA